MTATSLEQLADANLIESIREHARWQGPVELVEEGGLLLFAGRTVYPGAYRNAVARIDPSVSAREVLARARAFFAARERGFTLWALNEADRDLDGLATTSACSARPTAHACWSRRRCPYPPCLPSCASSASTTPTMCAMRSR